MHQGREGEREMTTPAEKHKIMTVTLDRRIFVIFCLLVGITTGVSGWTSFTNRAEYAHIREDRRIFDELKKEVDHTKEIAERADEQVRAVRDFSRCAFVLVLGLDLPQAKAEFVIQKCVKEAKFPNGKGSPAAPVAPRER